MIRDSSDDINFAHKLLLIDTHISRLFKAFASNSSANIELSKTQLSKMQSGGFLQGIISQQLKNLRTITNVFVANDKGESPKKAAKNLLDIGYNEISSVKVSGLTLTNNEIQDIIKAIRSLENRRILLKGTTENIVS